MTSPIFLNTLLRGAAGFMMASLPAGAATVPVAGAPTTQFVRLGPDQTGVDMVNRMEINHALSYLYHSGMTCGGVVVEDLNGDGRPELVFGGGREKSRIYRNTGGPGEIKFADATASSGFANGGGKEEWVAGIAAGDANGDGKSDLYVCRYLQPNQLWLNATGADGVVKFTVAPDSCGLGAVDCSHSAAFADYDGDGDLDLYLLTNRIEDPAGTRQDIKELTQPGEGGLPVVKPEFEKYYSMWRYDFDHWGTETTGTPDLLYRNDSKDGVVKFTDVSREAGIAGRGDGLSVTWWDYNRDGWPDIYVGNDFISGDRLYKNNGNGTFTDVIAEAAPHTPWFSMGCDQGDVNNDLLPDLLVADMSATSHFKSKTTMGVMGGLDAKRAYFASPQQQMQNTLLIGTGTERFSEGARLYGVSSTDWTWAVKFADFDNDGWQDIYFTNGISRHMNDSDIKVTQDMLVGKHMFEFWKNGEMRKEKNRAYRNTGHAKFEEVSDAWGLGHVGVSYGAAYADLDQDGDVDIVTVNLEEPNGIWRNDAAGRHWLAVDLIGTKGNRHAIGAEIVVKTSSGPQMRYLSPQTGYHSYNEPVVHFGLGSETVVTELKIRWPGKDGGGQILTNVKADQRLKVERPARLSPRTPDHPVPAPLFKESQALASLKGKDTGWEADFLRHTLLPHSYSQLGPCMAWGDVNGDGKADVFYGGSAGELAQLRLADGKGGFVGKWTEGFRADKDCEDSGAVFLDADGDRDLDLCVVSGTNEFLPDAPEQRARLYLNDGKGGFTAGAGLPDIRVFAGAVAAADFDKDGLTDLFIGARCKAQDWPHSDRSRLLRNVSAKGTVKFEDVTDKVAGLAAAGLVSSAAWADADGDSWPDLVLSCEWGPVRLFTNGKGRLKEATAESGLASVTGWWNSLTAADLNGDGKVDLVAGNLGLNSKYKTPDAEHPMVTYYGVFDDSGKCQVVEVKREKNELGDVLYPERGRSCSSTAMPFIKSKFPTFKTFAIASLTDVYSEDKLKAAGKYEANEFRSGAWMNQGAGKFTWTPFIREAQNAPVFGIAAADFTGDGKVDLFLAQNWLHGPQIETSRYDNGVGLLLKNDGQGNFAPMAPLESGISLSGCMKAVAVQDVNGDGKMDLVVTRNSAPAVVLEKQ
jgi:hypothetical protein